jgi:hypothetical protein
MAVALSPAAVVFGGPFAFGIGSDLSQSAWLGPLALTLAAAVAINARRRDIYTAPKSIT